MSETRELLSSLNADVLRALARQFGPMPSTAPNKSELIQALDALLGNELPRVLEQLSDVERKYLAELAYGSDLSGLRFEAKYGVKAPSPSSYSYSRSYSALLLFLGGYGYQQGLPPPLAKGVREHLEPPASARLATTSELPDTFQSETDQEARPIHVYEGERTAFSDLRSVLQLVQAGKLKVAEKSGRPTEEAVRLTAGSLREPDFSLDPPRERTDDWAEQAGAVRAHAWGVLAQECGWAKARGQRLMLTDAGRQVLGSSSASDFAKGVGLFLANGQFDEFNRINHIRGQSGNGARYLTAVGDRRGAITDSMCEWPVNHWIAFHEAARFLVADGHDFEVTRAEHTLYLGELQYGMLDGFGLSLSRQYMRAFLMESLATLGLVDIAYVYPHSLWPDFGECWGVDSHSFCGRYDGLMYVRLNRLGAYCLELTDSYEPPVSPSAGAFRILSNREVAFLGAGPVPMGERHVLELFAAPKSDVVWELDAPRILDHLESGGSLDDLVRFLESNCAGPIPDTVRAMLADLERGASAAVRTEDALLIEFRDDVTAALIAHDTQTRKSCVLAGRRLVVLKKNLRAFRTALKKLGMVVPEDRLPR
jgi:hypothetical protein